MSKNGDFFCREKIKRIKFLLILFPFLLSLIQVGCNNTISYWRTESFETGIEVTYPRKWKSHYTERNGMISIYTNSNQNESALIEINGSACYFDLSSEAPVSVINTDIDRIQQLYELPTIQIIEYPTFEVKGNYEITTALISIPTSALEDDQFKKQMGEESEDVFQVVEILHFAFGKKSVMAYIYFGKDDLINLEAQEIINTIVFSCD